MHAVDYSAISDRIEAIRAETPNTADAVRARGEIIEDLLALNRARDEIANGLPFVVAVHDEHGHCLFATQSTHHSAEMAARDATSARVPFAQWLNSDVDLKAAFAAQLRRVRVTGRAELDVLYESASSGAVREVSAIPLVGADGTPERVLTVDRPPSAQTRESIAVHAHEARFREVVAHSPNALIVQVAGSIRYASPSAARMLGVESSDELIGRDSLDFMAPHERETMLARRLAVQDTHTSQPVWETRHQRSDGSVFASELSVAPFEWDGEQGTVNIVRDITDRNAAQEAAKRSELRAESLLSSLPGGAYRFRHTRAESGEVRSRLEFVSEGARELFGYSPAMLLGDLDLSTLIHPDDYVEGRRLQAISDASGDTFEHKYRLKRADGSWYWMLHVSREVERTADSLVTEGILIDIDAQIRAEQALEARTKLMQTVIDTVPAAAITLRDREGQYVLISRHASQFFGLNVSLDEAIGKRIEDLVPNWRPTIGEVTHEEVLATGQAIVGREYASTLKPGSWRILSAAPVFTSAGKIGGVVQVSIDITEGKLAEQDAARHRDELEALVSERTRELAEEVAEHSRAQEALVAGERRAATGEVAASVTRELRRPLGAVERAVQALKTCVASPTTPRGAATWRRGERSLARCHRIIEQFSSYADARPLRKTRVDVDALCAELADQLEVPSDVVVHCALSSGVSILIDAEQLREALGYVLDNAIQAASQPAGGVSNTTVALRTRQVSDRVEIEIHDDGPGIARADLSRVFEPLFSTRPFGVGLGLPLARRVVEAHGGDIGVTSARGTTVVMRLPCCMAGDDARCS